MIHSIRFTCVLDTNVIFPFEVRDMLLWFAHYELFTPKWSKHIFDEWEDVMRRHNVPEEVIAKRLQAPNKAFPDALVTDYEVLIDFLDLPDPKDKHVLAAAIKSNANIIVTNNLKDFPSKLLDTYGLSAKSPDDFLTDIIDLNHEIAASAFRELVLYRRNPDLDEFQVLERLRKNGLRATADYLHAIL
ncbi:MAG: PIN domain-containing protein [Saprospiraceae bacterium]|nr:PIN domain-containing protein [Saprospiraceae bacterium]